MRFTAKKKKHQQESLDRIKATFKTVGYHFLISGMSTGKTLTALFLAAEMDDVEKVLVVTTAAACEDAWASNIEEHVLDGMTYIIPSGSSVKKSKKMKDYIANNTGKRFVIINYETAWRLGDAIKKCGFDLVVLDESHKIKSYNSNVSLELAKACWDVPYKLCMTGTSWKDRPSDCFGQVRFLSPEFPRYGYVKSSILGSWKDYYERFTWYETRDNIPIIKAHRNQDILAGILAPFTTIFETRDVTDLPEQTFINKYIPMTKEMKDIYEELDDELTVEIGDDTLTAGNILTKALYLHQITSGFYSIWEGSDVKLEDNKLSLINERERLVKPIPGKNPKLNALLEVLDEAGGQPVVVFVRFTSDAQLIYSTLTKKGFKPRLLTGKVNELSKWKAGDGDVLIVNMQTGSASVDLTRAHLAVLYSIGYSNTNYEQALMRICRSNSSKDKDGVYHPVTYIMLIVQGSVDVDIYNALKEKTTLDKYLTNKVKS